MICTRGCWPVLLPACGAASACGVTEREAMGAGLPGAEGWTTRPLRTPSARTPEPRKSKLPPSPCRLPCFPPSSQRPRVWGERADTHTQTHTPPGRLCSPHILPLFCFSGARMGTRCTHNWQLPPVPPTEVPYVSVMNKHEAPGQGGLGSGSCQSPLRRRDGAIPGWGSAARWGEAGGHSPG